MYLLSQSVLSHRLCNPCLQFSTFFNPCFCIIFHHSWCYRTVCLNFYYYQILSVCLSVSTVFVFFPTIPFPIPVCFLLSHLFPLQLQLLKKKANNPVHKLLFSTVKKEAIKQNQLAYFWPKYLFSTSKML